MNEMALSWLYKHIMTIMSKWVNIISSVGGDGNDGIGNIGNIGIHVLKSDSNIMGYDIHFIIEEDCVMINTRQANF
jgi:hypothetical protein